MPEVRTGQGDVKLTREDFARRIGERFYDPAFDGCRPEIGRIIETAWKNYDEYHKSPRTSKAGAGFEDPEFDLPLEWPDEAKALELRGWHYPRHLAGRLFGIVVHGDAAGADTLRRSLADWLQDMHLVPASPAALLDRYIGYYEPYATSHVALDKDTEVQSEVRNVARSLMQGVRLLREGTFPLADRGLTDPRQK